MTLSGMTLIAVDQSAFQAMLDDAIEKGARRALLQHATAFGTRFNKKDVRTHFGICGRTLTNWQKKGFPKPDADGQWSAAVIMTYSPNSKSTRRGSPNHQSTD